MTGWGDANTHTVIVATVTLAYAVAERMYTM